MERMPWLPAAVSGVEACSRASSGRVKSGWRRGEENGEPGYYKPRKSQKK